MYLFKKLIKGYWNGLFGNYNAVLPDIYYILVLNLLIPDKNISKELK